MFRVITSCPPASAVAAIIRSRSPIIFPARRSAATISVYSSASAAPKGTMGQWLRTSSTNRSLSGRCSASESSIPTLNSATDTALTMGSDGNSSGRSVRPESRRSISIRHDVSTTTPNPCTPVAGQPHRERRCRARTRNRGVVGRPTLPTTGPPLAFAFGPAGARAWRSRARCVRKQPLPRRQSARPTQAAG